MGRPGKILDREFLYHEYVVLGKRVTQIGRENHCLPRRVSEQLRACGIEVRKKPIRAREVEKLLTPEFLAEHYLRLGKTATQIQEETGVHRDTICGYLKKFGFAVRHAPGRPREEMAGRVFGRLTVRSFSHRDTAGRAHWLCDCRCGNSTTVSGKDLRRKDSRGGVRSCGCMKSDIKYRLLPGALWSSIVCGAKSRGIAVTITPEQVEELFEVQGGKCALTGRPLTMTPAASRTASLDRIDSSRGYEAGNIQWVHKTVNIMKGQLTEDVFLQLCLEIVAYRCQGAGDRGQWVPRATPHSRSEGV